MPLVPTGLSPGLYDRIVNRVKQELAGPPTGQPPATEAGFLSRVKRLVQQRLAPEGQPEPKWEDLGPPTSLADLKWRIQFAARQSPPRILSLTYNNQTRDVEPYSYRYRAREQPHIPLFYGFCAKDQSINAFKLQKISDCQITNRVFEKRWPVEL